MQTVAHSEQECKSAVRHLRHASLDGLVYQCRMKHRIKAMREERGWTVDVLASKVGMSRSYVSEIENGKKSVNNVRLGAFAKAFEVTPIDLIDDESVGADVLDHIRRLRRLSDADRRAVIRHAIVLDPGEDEH